MGECEHQPQQPGRRNKKSQEKEQVAGFATESVGRLERDEKPLISAAWVKKVSEGAAVRAEASDVGPFERSYAVTVAA